MRVIQVRDNAIKESVSIAIVVSRFNEKITQALLEGALARLKEKNVDEQRITVVWVPGAIEIPLAAQKLAAKTSYDAIICLGCVIQGETKHFDYVCDQASHGCSQVMLSYEIPVIFGVLTTDNQEQALARAGGKKGHKGQEAVDTALEMISVLEHF